MSEKEVDELEDRLKEIAAEHEPPKDGDNKCNPTTWMDDLDQPGEF